MTALYRFVIGREEIVAPGKLEKADGSYVLTVKVSVDQAMTIRGVGAKSERKARVEVIVGDLVVAVMPVLRAELGPASGTKVDLWVIVA